MPVLRLYICLFTVHSYGIVNTSLVNICTMSLLFTILTYYQHSDCMIYSYFFKCDERLVFVTEPRVFSDLELEFLYTI